MQEDRTVRFRPEEGLRCRKPKRGRALPESRRWICGFTPFISGMDCEPHTYCRQYGESRSQTAIASPFFQTPCSKTKRLQMPDKTPAGIMQLPDPTPMFAKGLACIRTNEADTIPFVQTGGPADPRVFRLPESETVLSTIRPPQQNPPYRRPSLRGMQAAIACSF